MTNRDLNKESELLALATRLRKGGSVVVLRKVLLQLHRLQRGF